MYTENNYIMWISRVAGITNKKAIEIIDKLGSAKEAWYCDKTTLLQIPKISVKNAESIISARKESIIEKYIVELYKKQISYITRNDKEYPYLLKHIPNPPVGFYMIGEMPNEDIPKISIVGSRKCTQYGAHNTEKITKELSENGIVIVSGLAEGIDGIAHKAALETGGKTIAVLGNGVDLSYPSVNAAIRKKIIENGCIISEFPPETPPYQSNFPMRNRIVSGLSLGLIVMEASLRSGTLITVGNALDQGRDVFALPGNITSQFSEGTNELIKQGAFLITSADDVLNILGIEKKKENTINNKNFSSLLAPEEKLVYDCISFEPISVDEIIIKTNIVVKNVQSLLTMLELKGLIKKISGQKYILS